MSGSCVMASSADFTAVLTQVDTVHPRMVRMAFSAPEFSALPGQFLEIEVSPEPFPMTRRPFTINRVVPGGFEIVFDVVGRGTALLAELRPGAAVRTLGPLGNGWRLCPGRWLLVGGGMGAAGFPFLAASLHEPPTVLLGASTSDRLLGISGDQRTITEDGSGGTRGRVTDLLSDADFSSYSSVAVCGPVPMMRAVFLAVPQAYRHLVQISAESRMGCGWGVCEGCAIPVAGGGYLKCCTDGPVFPGHDLDWERWTE